MAFRSNILSSFATVSTLFLFAGSARAAGSNMPWETTFADITSSVTGPTLGAIATLVILGVGYAVSTGDNSSGIRRGLWAVAGIGIAASAANLLSWLGFAGGALVP
ncbi:MAG: TrbC/VirB2 family protein [Rhodospirillaceae bacterium]